MRARLIKFLILLLGALPLSLLHAVGAALGKLLFLIPNRRRRTAQVNLALCFPELSDAERERLLRRNLIEAGKTTIEIFKLWSIDKAAAKKIVTQISGQEELNNLIKQGKGLIFAAPHLGAWELAGPYCSIDYPISGIFFRDSERSAMSELVRELRGRFGARTVPMNKAGVRALYQALQRGELLWLMPDQVPARDAGGVFAPFFGIPASTMVLLSRFAAKTGAPVVFVYAERLAHGHGYHLHFLPAPASIGSDDMQTSVASVNAMVEKCARERPEQYQWIYKRFRVRPPGAAPFY
jgi:KDO2-lipid IV(A) lauroyltransferase